MNATSQYEIFPRGRHLMSSRGLDPFVNCGKQRITFNKACTELLPSSRVFLLWDKANKEFGVQPTENPVGYLVSRNLASLQSYVTCKSFLTFTGLSGAGSISAKWDSGSEILSWFLPNGEQTEKSEEIES